MSAAALTDEGLALGEHLIAHTELGGGTRLAVLPRPLVGRLCARRKVPLAAVLLTNETAKPVACSDLVRPTLLGQRVQHLQFTNSFTRQRVFAAMHWSSSSAAATGAAPRLHEPADGGNTLGCGLSPTELARRLPTNEQHGVLISSAVADYSLYCVSLVGTRSQPARCPCCWVAPRAAARETTRCTVWNPNV